MTTSGLTVGIQGTLFGIPYAAGAILARANDLRLLAARNTADQKSSNKNSSASVGIGTDGLLFNVGDSAGRGKAAGSDTTHSLTKVGAGGTAHLSSGSDTTLQGAVVSGQQVVATVGGDLRIESLQDSSAYDSKQKNSSFSLSVPIGPGSIGGSVSAGKSKIDSDYRSVNEQSGLNAGDGGFTGDASGGIEQIFDADKVQKEINAQVQITQAFGQQASKAVGDYMQEQKQTLREAYKNAPDADRAAIQAQFDDLILQERVMNVLIGAVTGLSSPALAKETLALAADEMHRISVESSMRSSGFVDAYGNVITNLRPGEEDKLRQDIDLAGTRLDPDGICGKAYERCVIQRDENNAPILDANGRPQFIYSAEGRMQFRHVGDDDKPVSLPDFLATDEGKKMFGFTGGIQGGTATFAGYDYPAGGVVDRVFKAFGGPHDLIGGQAVGLYDEQGNTLRGRSDAEKIVHDTWSAVAIAPSTPFAMAELLPPEVWKAISILLGAAK